MKIAIPLKPITDSDLQASFGYSCLGLSVKFVQLGKIYLPRQDLGPALLPFMSSISFHPYFLNI
jgi:hypothetical protein